MAKITRLNDPSNPYNVKKTPTSGPTEEQKIRNKARSDALRAYDRPLPPSPPEKKGIMQRANEEYMESRKRTINKAIQEAGG